VVPEGRGEAGHRHGVGSVPDDLRGTFREGPNPGQSLRQDTTTMQVSGRWSASTAPIHDASDEQ
jgi:hypothetical protein